MFIKNQIKMVSIFQRAKQKVSLFFQPAVETTKEIVSQIPGVDLTKPEIGRVKSVEGFTPVPFEEIITRRGGGGIGVSTSRGVSDAQLQADRLKETQRIAEEQARKKVEADIERTRQTELKEARETFQQRILRAKTSKQRQEAIQSFAEQAEISKLKAQVGRVETGITTKAFSPLLAGAGIFRGEVTTPQEAEAIKEIITIPSPIGRASTPPPRIEDIIREVSRPTLFGIGAFGLKGRLPFEGQQTRLATDIVLSAITSPKFRLPEIFAISPSEFRREPIKTPIEISKTLTLFPVVSIRKEIQDLEEELLKSQKFKLFEKITQPSVLGFGDIGLKGFGERRITTTIGAIGDIIPTTPAEVFVLSQIPRLPKLVRGFGALGISGFKIREGIKGAKGFRITATSGFALEKIIREEGITAEEQIAKVRKTFLVGGLAGAGAFIELAPFVRGISAKTLGRIKGKFKPVRIQEEGFRAIERVDKIERIALIEEGDIIAKGKTFKITLPKTSPLRSGRDVLTPTTRKLFLGKQQRLATSQISLFEKGKEIPIEREFFVTPQEPFLKIPETRLSRLGIEKFFKTPKDFKIGIGLPPKAQIGLITADVGVRETATGFKIGRGTELEAIKTFGTIRDIKNLGITTIKGQAVDIFGFKIGRGGAISGRAEIPTSLTTDVSRRVSGEALLGLAEIIKTLRITTPRTTPPISRRATIPISPPISQVSRRREPVRRLSSSLSKLVSELSKPPRRTRTPLRIRTPTITPPTITRITRRSTRIIPPQPPILPDIFLEPREKIRKKRRDFLKDFIIFSEGFTAKAIGAEPRIIKLKDVLKEEQRIGKFAGIRGAPIIVR